MKNKIALVESLIFTYQSKENTIASVIEDNNIWLTQKSIADLFECDVRVADKTAFVRVFRFVVLADESRIPAVVAFGIVVAGLRDRRIFVPARVGRKAVVVAVPGPRQFKFAP